MIHLGDITKINGARIPPVDVVTGGSPCQDLSLAGKRAGLAGERSGLFMEQIRIVKEMRERERATGRAGWMVRPRYMVWENVDGARTSPGGNRKGADFAAVLEEIIKAAEPGADVCVCVPDGGWTKSGCYYAEDGSWSVAWRVHDAQFWGVPQRRKRISLVADFGGLSAPEILFERKGLSGDSEPCGEAGQETAGAVGEGATGASCYGLDHVMLSGGTTYQGRGYYDNVSGCLKTQPHGVCESFSIDKAITTGGNCTAGGDCIHSEYTPALTTDRPHAVCETISFQERGGKPGGGKGILIQHEHVGALSTLNNQSVLQIGCDVYNHTITGDVAATLNATSCDSPTHSGPSVLAISVDEKMGQTYIGEEVGNTLAARDYKQPQAVVYGISSYDSNAMKSPNPHSGIYEADTARTLDLNGGSPACNQGGIAVLCLNDQGGSVMGVSEDVTGALRAEEHGHQPILFEPRSQDGVPRIHGDVSPTLNTAQGGQRQPCVMCIGNGQANQSIDDKAGALNCMHDQQAILTTVGALCARDYKGVGNQYVEEGKVIPQNAIVRRLTPLECERLQGYPDGWTDIGEWVDSKGKKHKAADSPRYKALGNSIALPFWFWLLRRISAQYERPATLGSLFDGIGGFPLCWERCNGHGTALWASEIEEFPIAVTKIRFPETI